MWNKLFIHSFLIVNIFLGTNTLRAESEQHSLPQSEEQTWDFLRDCVAQLPPELKEMGNDLKAYIISHTEMAQNFSAIIENIDNSETLNSLCQNCPKGLDPYIICDKKVGSKPYDMQEWQSFVLDKIQQDIEIALSKTTNFSLEVEEWIAKMFIEYITSIKENLEYCQAMLWSFADKQWATLYSSVYQKHVETLRKEIITIEKEIAADIEKEMGTNIEKAITTDIETVKYAMRVWEETPDFTYNESKKEHAPELPLRAFISTLSPIFDKNTRTWYDAPLDTTGALTPASILPPQIIQNLSVQDLDHLELICRDIHSYIITEKNFLNEDKRTALSKLIEESGQPWWEFINIRQVTIVVKNAIDCWDEIIETNKENKKKMPQCPLTAFIRALWPILGPYGNEDWNNELRQYRGTTIVPEAILPQDIINVLPPMGLQDLKKRCEEMNAYIKEEGQNPELYKFIRDSGQDWWMPLVLREEKDKYGNIITNESVIRARAEEKALEHLGASSLRMLTIYHTWESIRKDSALTDKDFEILFKTFAELYHLERCDWSSVPYVLGVNDRIVPETFFPASYLAICTKEELRSLQDLCHKLTDYFSQKAPELIFLKRDASRKTLAYHIAEIKHHSLMTFLLTLYPEIMTQDEWLDIPNRKEDRTYQTLSQWFAEDYVIPHGNIHTIWNRFGAHEPAPLQSATPKLTWEEKKHYVMENLIPFLNKQYDKQEASDIATQKIEAQLRGLDTDLQRARPTVHMPKVSH